VASLVVSKVV